MTAPALTFSISDEARAAAAVLIEQGLAPVLGGPAAALAAHAITGPGYEELLAQLCDMPGVEIDAIELVLERRED